MISKSKIYGLVGLPIKHSLSPRMHNAAFRFLKINARYKLFPLKEAQLEKFLQELKKHNIRGFNVTYPYKEKFLKFVNRKSSGVREIGSLNTVVAGKDGKLKGFNTDYLGFMAHLKELKVRPKNAALIGAGGAAKAVGVALARMKISRLSIYDIDRFKSLDLYKKLSAAFPEIEFSVAGCIGDLGLPEKDLLVNASPVGMRREDPCLFSPQSLHPGLFVYDLIYSPSQTKLLSLANDRGLKFSNGLGMLLYQGVFAFQHFSGRKAPVEVMRKALLKSCL
ncbi:MAG: shikimate dehydrogenase [Candidatus Omnitrophota bacterium]